SSRTNGNGPGGPTSTDTSTTLPTSTDGLSPATPTSNSGPVTEQTQQGSGQLLNTLFAVGIGAILVAIVGFVAWRATRSYSRSNASDTDTIPSLERRFTSPPVLELNFPPKNTDSMSSSLSIPPPPATTPPRQHPAAAPMAILKSTTPARPLAPQATNRNSMAPSDWSSSYGRSSMPSYMQDPGMQPSNGLSFARPAPALIHPSPLRASTVLSSDQSSNPYGSNFSMEVDDTESPPDNRSSPQGQEWQPFSKETWKDKWFKQQ
ncbi:hypothetical protein HDU91_004766, partial [Kappamyces sp. JEL0680]